MGKDGRSFSIGTQVELETDYAEHLVRRNILAAVKKRTSKVKQRAVIKPDDLEQAVED